MSSAEQFEWFGQLRHYWKPTLAGTASKPALYVQLADISMSHAYEYHSQQQDFSFMGTPVKPRDLVSIASAISSSCCASLACSSYGSSGQGLVNVETWTIAKATAAAFGRCCVEVNCCGSFSMKKLIEQIVQGIAACGAWGILTRSELLHPGLVSWLHYQVVPSFSQSKLSKPHVEQAGIAHEHQVPNDFMLFFCESGRESRSQRLSVNLLEEKDEVKLCDRSFRTVGIRVQEPTRVIFEAVLRSVGAENCAHGSKLAVAVLREARERLPERPEYQYVLNSGRIFGRYLKEYCTIQEDVERSRRENEDCSRQSSPQIKLVDGPALVRQAVTSFLMRIVHPNDTQYVGEIAKVFEEPGSTAEVESQQHLKPDAIEWTLWPQSIQKLLGDVGSGEQDKDALVANAQLLWRCLSSGKLAIILGDPGSGKSTCQKYLRAMLTEHGQHIDLRRIYHETLAPEELWGHGLQCSDHPSPARITSFMQQQMCSKSPTDKPICAGSRGDAAITPTDEGPEPNPPGKSSWLVLDGRAGGEASDSLCCLFDQIRIPGILRSTVYRANNQYVMWETDSLMEASPTLCSAPIVHIKPFARDLRSLMYARLDKYWETVVGNCDDHVHKPTLDDLCGMAISVIETACSSVLTIGGSTIEHRRKQKEQIGRRVLALIASLGDQIQKNGKVRTSLSENLWDVNACVTGRGPCRTKTSTQASRWLWCTPWHGGLVARRITPKHKSGLNLLSAPTSRMRRYH